MKFIAKVIITVVILSIAGEYFERRELARKEKE